MKLSDVKPYYESSGQMEEHFFSIEDQGMIFDILRSKMYSNPILAICREITSNARDAHREVGKQDQPIHIHLPIGLEPDYKVKDFGPGISPDRMLNIFIKYTASTKRGDNLQTGGFGLGAKTPFSYSDQFQVTTVVDGIRYSYACSIDDTKVGKLILLDERPSDEPNSTEISIPVKPQDFNFFKQWTEQACRHWDVKPLIRTGSIDWQTFNKVLEGKGWAIAGTTDWQKAAKLVIDGIEYPLELDALRKYADPKLIDSARGFFIMYFGVGELSLSANREQIFLDKPTQEKIKKRLDTITREIKQKVSEKIDAFPNLWAANVYYRKELTHAFTSLDFLGKLEWKGHTLNNGYVNLKCRAFTFTKGKYSRKYGSDPNKLTRSNNTSLHFEENTELYINDLPLKEPTPRHVKKAFEDNPNLNSVQVICPDDKQSEVDLDKDIFLNLMGPKKLSSITKASSRNYTAPTSRLLVFKFDPVASAFRQVSYNLMEEDTNLKVLCLLNKDTYNNSRSANLANKKVLGQNSLKSLLELNPKVSFYGVDQATDQSRIDEEFSEFQDLNSFIDDNVLNNTTINYVEIKFAKNHSYHIDERMLKHTAQLEPKIQDPDSFYLKRLQLHKKIKKLSNLDTGLLDIYESVNGEITDKALEKFVKDNPNWDLDTINSKYETVYPLLGVINTYNYSQILEHIVHYVNMADKI